MNKQFQTLKHELNFLSIRVSCPQDIDIHGQLSAQMNLNMMLFTSIKLR